MQLDEWKMQVMTTDSDLQYYNSLELELVSKAIDEFGLHSNHYIMIVGEF